MNGIKLIIAGCRDLNDYGVVIAAMEAYLALRPLPTEIVSGAAAGADALGEQWAVAHGIPVKRFPAEWDKYGASAGPRRNATMAAYADELVCCWDGESRGSKNMIATMRHFNKPVCIHRIPV
jgi:hypothetical protein